MPDRPSSDAAIAVLRANEAYDGKILGPSDPAPGPGVSTQQVTGQLIPPANPQRTVNSSIGSPPTPAITSGAGGSGVTAVAMPATSSVTASTLTTNATEAIVGATPVAGGTVPFTSPITNAVTVTSATPASTATARSHVVTAKATTTGTAKTAHSASGPVRIETPASGGVVVTNRSPSLAQRFLAAIGLRRSTTAAATSSTTTTSGTAQVPEVIEKP